MKVGENVVKSLETRNRKIFLEKTGRKSLKDDSVVNKPVTYRALMIKYNLSLKRLQDIVNRERLRLLMMNKNGKK